MSASIGDAVAPLHPLQEAARHGSGARNREGRDARHLRFRSAFDHAPIGMALVATDGRLLDVNGALCAKLGYDADELVRLRWQDLTHPRDLEADEQLLAGLLTGNDDRASREKWFVRSDGTELCAQLSVSRVRGTGDEDDYFVQQIQDISARKHAERVAEQQAFMFDALHEAAMITDTAGRVKKWNQAAELMFSLAEREADSRCLATLMLDRDGESASMLLDTLRKVGRWTGELSFRLAGGEVGVAGITAAATGEPDGRQRAYAIVARDITDRCAAEQQTREHSRRLSSLLNIQHLIKHVGPDRAAIQRLVAERLLELVPGDGAAVVLPEGNGMLSVAASGRNGWREELHVAASGTAAGRCIEDGRILQLDGTDQTSWRRCFAGEHVESRSSVYVPLLHDGLTSGALVLIASDSEMFDQADIDAMQLMAGALAAALSHAARFEENQALAVARSESLMALQAVEQRYRALLEHARDVILVLALDGTVEYVSPAMTPVLGYQPNELIGRTVGHYVHPDDIDALRTQQDRLLVRAGMLGSLDFRVRHRDGSWRQLAGRASNQVDHSALGGLVLNLQDVTDSRQMEEHLRQAQKLEAIGQLAAGIAHEINTPVQYVGDNVRFLDTAFADLIGLLDCFQNARSVIADHQELAQLSADLGQATERADLTYLGTEIPLALNQSLEGLDRIAEIVRSVRSFSHPGGDVKAPADLNREIANTVSVSRNEWKYDAEVELDLAFDLPPVHCMISEINQVVLNLIVNAAHSISDQRRSQKGVGKGLITISTRLQGDWCEVRVADTGCGIPERVRPRLFDPFFTTKEVGRGTGQGLAIARTVITEKHGGRIDFETQVGIGTTFIIRLPVLMEEAAASVEGS